MAAGRTRAKDLFVHRLSIADSGFKSRVEGTRMSYEAEQNPRSQQRAGHLTDPSQGADRPP
jgi:cold shock CspA family protein